MLKKQPTRRRFMATGTSGTTYKDPLAEGYFNSLVQENLRATSMYNNFQPVWCPTEKQLEESYGAFSTRAKAILSNANLIYTSVASFTERAAKLMDELKEFEEANKKTGKELQEKTASEKPLYTLQCESYEMLFKHYKIYVAAYARVGVLADLLNKSIEKCKPLARSVVEDKTFREHAPDCHSEILKVEETCKAYLDEMIANHKAVVDFKDKLYKKLNDNSGIGYLWSIQRVCQIVENGGEPLSMIKRGVNKTKYPSIPLFPEKYPEETKPITPGEVPTGGSGGSGILRSVWNWGSRSNSPAPKSEFSLTSSTPAPNLNETVLPVGEDPLTKSTT